MLCVLALVILFSAMGRIKDRILIALSILFALIAVCSITCVLFWDSISISFMSLLTADTFGLLNQSSMLEQQLYNLCTLLELECFRIKYPFYCLVGAAGCFVVVALVFGISAIKVSAVLRFSLFGLTV